MSIYTDNRGDIEYACGIIRSLRSYDLECIFVSDVDNIKFVSGVLCASGVNRVEVVSRDDELLFYQVDLDGEKRLIISFNKNKRTLDGVYIGLFFDTTKAIYFLECFFDEISILPPAIREARIDSYAKSLEISSVFIINVAKRC